MFSTYTHILENAKLNLQKINNITQYTTKLETPKKETLKSLISKHKDRYLTTESHTQPRLDMFREKIKTKSDSPNIIKTLVDSYSVNSYYSETDYDDISFQTTSTTTRIDPYKYSKILTETQHNILINLATSNETISKNELSKFSTPIYTKYNNVVNESFDTKVTNLYSHLYTYYLPYEPNKASTYYIKPNNTTPSKIDIYESLYKDQIQKLGDIIKYHDTTYSIPLDSLDTTSTINNITLLRQTNKYLTTNLSSNTLTHEHVSKYMTKNNEIVPSSPEPAPEVVKSDYEISREELFQELPDIFHS